MSMREVVEVLAVGGGMVLDVNASKLFRTILRHGKGDSDHAYVPVRHLARRTVLWLTRCTKVQNAGAAVPISHRARLRRGAFKVAKTAPRQ